MNYHPKGLKDCKDQAIKKFKLSYPMKIPPPNLGKLDKERGGKAKSIKETTTSSKRVKSAYQSFSKSTKSRAKSATKKEKAKQVRMNTPPSTHHKKNRTKIKTIRFWSSCLWRRYSRKALKHIRHTYKSAK